MLMTPALVLFWMSIVLSMLMICSSSSPFVAWLALELSTLAFIPFILSSRHLSGEAALKYFLSQSLGSVLFMYALIHWASEDFFGISNFLLMCSLVLKLGAAPFHAWMPAMVSSLDWDVFFMLMTVQKFNPLILLGTYPFFPKLLLIISLSSLLVGSLMGLLQTQVRKILAYSSINQIGWLSLALWSSNSLMLLYFSFYSILLLPVVWMMKTFCINLLKQLVSSKLGLKAQLIMFLNLLSFGGLPPFLGFFPKWLVLSQLICLNQLFTCLIMVLTSLITLFFYLRLTFNSFLMSSNQWHLSHTKVSTKLIFLSQLNFAGLSLGFLF